MRNLIDDVLSVSDCDITAVPSDSEALKLLRSADSKFQVVVCPAPAVGAKHSLVSKIRSSAGELGKLPVICLSPATGLQERAVAYESGASEYMLLPFSPVTLADRVRHWARHDHKPY